MLPVLRDIASGRDKMGKILATYNQNMGAVNRLNEERLKTDAGVIDQWQSGLENLTVTAGAALGRVFTPVLQFGTRLVNIINSVSETWAGGFALRVIATGVVVGTIVAGFKTLRGIMQMTSYLQTLTTRESNGMSAAAIKTNTQFAIMEAHMVSMVNLMRTMVQLQMMMGGIGMNSKGRFYNSKTGRFVKTPNPGVPLATTMGASLIGGAVGQGMANTGGQIIRQGTAKGLASIGGRLLGFLGGPIGIGITVLLPLLIEGISYLSNSVDRNTDAQNNKENDPLTMRAQNEERFLNAMRAAIRDGLRDGKIGITIEGQSAGDYTLGSQQDYTGVVLGL